jgi:hypothetical protein
MNHLWAEDRKGMEKTHTVLAIKKPWMIVTQGNESNTKT